MFRFRFVAEEVVEELLDACILEYVVPARGGRVGEQTYNFILILSSRDPHDNSGIDVR